MKRWLPLIIVISFGLLAAKGLFGPGYFNMHDDLQMMRQLELEKCFLTLQIPCRWIPDMGYGFGFPLFNFYPPLPYLFGEIFRIFGIAFVDVVKITFIFAFVASGISMYFLAKEFFGKWGGVISSIFYIWAPYHSVDIYVRGAMNEAWALIFFPAILWFGYRLIQNNKKRQVNIILLALSWTGLLLSHNLMAMIFAPIFAGWCLIWIIKSKVFVPSFIKLGIAGVLTLGLAAFFTLPVTIEQGLVQTQTLVQGYYEYSVHFATVSQLFFSRFWGYGPSIWEANDGMSFQVGYFHWILSIIIFVISAVTFWKKRKINNWFLVIFYFFIVGWFALFMIHNKSTPLWMNVSTLRFVQFPWRFMTLVMLALSLVAGGLVNFIPKKKNWIIFLIIGGLLISNWNYFIPQHGKLGALTDKEKFNGAAWDLQRTAGIYDYLPNTAKTAPKAPMTDFTEVMSGEAKSTNIKLGTNFNSFDIDVSKKSEIRLGVFAFPDWKVFINGNEIPTYISESEEWGRMYVQIPEGKYHVEVKLYNTSIRNFSNIFSLVTWSGLIGYLLVRRGNLLS